MKKIIFALAASILIFICGCGNNNSNLISNQSLAYSNEQTIKDYTGNGSAWKLSLFDNPSTVYNNDLAFVAAEMSDHSEDNLGINIYDLIVNKYGIINGKEYNYPGDSAFMIGHDKFLYNGESTTVLFIVARGTKTESEMIGDLFKGMGDDKYHSFLGQSIYDNVYDFEEEVWAGLADYINGHPELKDKNTDLKILCTGHSLGGAAANLVGARITEGSENLSLFSRSIRKDDIYVYTFGAIKVFPYERNAALGYENIHNIYNFYDSFGPNGNQAGRHVSSPSSKFGHTEIYSLDDGEFVAVSCNNHLMGNYKKALEKYNSDRDFIELACDPSHNKIENEIKSEEKNEETLDENEQNPSNGDVQRDDSAVLEIPPVFVGNSITLKEETTETHMNSGLKYVDGKTGDTYLYTAPRDGIYGFMLYDVNDDADLGVDVYDRFNERIMNDYSGTGCAKLKAGERYNITVYCRYGNTITGYKLDICPPKPITDISNATEINDQITYYGEENIYNFTAPASGRYRFDFIKPDNAYFHIDIYDELNNELVDDNSGYDDWTCEAGKTYRFVVTNYENGYCGYKLLLGYAKEAVDISNYNVIKDSIEFLNQENVYIFKATKNGKYSFVLDSDNKATYFDMRMYDSADNRMFSEYSGKTDAELEAGETYKIVITNEEKLGSYNLIIN